MLQEGLLGNRERKTGRREWVYEQEGKMGYGSPSRHKGIWEGRGLGGIPWRVEVGCVWVPRGRKGKEAPRGSLRKVAVA